MDFLTVNGCFTFAYYLPLSFSFISLIIVLKSFVERHQTTLSWILIIIGHFWIALSIAFNDQFTFDQILIYLSGIAVSGILGLVCLRWLKFHEDDIDLDRFQGHSYQHPKIALVFWSHAWVFRASPFPRHL